LVTCHIELGRKRTAKKKNAAINTEHKKLNQKRKKRYAGRRWGRCQLTVNLLNVAAQGGLHMTRRSTLLIKDVRA